MILEQDANSATTMSTVAAKLRALHKLDPTHPARDSLHSLLARALSVGLSFLNASHQNAQKTILIITPATKDDPTQYIPVMNSIFAAKKMSVRLDCCILSSNDLSYLQQASHITDGTYLKTTNKDELLQQLLTAFVCPPSLRSTFPQPIQYQVNCNTSCFCHKKSIDKGYVCTSCLSIYCTEQTQCSTCGQANRS